MAKGKKKYRVQMNAGMTVMQMEVPLIMIEIENVMTKGIMMIC